MTRGQSKKGELRLTRSAESRKTWKSRNRTATTRQTIGRTLSAKLRIGPAEKVVDIPEPQEVEGEDVVDGAEPIQESQEEQQARLERVMLGRLTDLPPLASHVIRVFISSTFSDMVEERNALMENVYPELKDFCKKYGLEFQVVDMRWGIREEVQDDHMTSSLCMKEIHKCQRLSAGPSFVVMFSQKYGYRPFPSEIAAEEYEDLLAALVENSYDVSVLETWYHKDENMVPPMYTLIPISSHLPNFVNRLNEELQDADRAKWWEIFNQIQQLLRTAADICSQQGRLHPSERQKYFISVTEDEIHHGIVLDSNHNRQIYMLRKIIDLDQHLGHKKAVKFIDLQPGSKGIDQEAQAYLTKLRDEAIPKVINRKYMANFDVQWNNAGGINPSFHKEYLKAFCKQFYCLMTKQIEVCLSLRDALLQDNLFVEVLQHLSSAKERCETFRGRGALIGRIKGYMMGESQQPMVVHGESGSGKTSLMAVVTSRVVGWYGGNASPVIVLRFLGTSPQSSSVCPMLMSLCQQISRNYGITMEETPVDVQHITNLFLKMIKNATEEKPLVIILDSLDQLSTSNHGHRLGWLPWQLPPNVRMIVSTLPQQYRLLSRLKMSITSEDNFVEVPSLGQELGLDLVKLWLQGEHRTLNPGQLELVKEAIHSCSLPLYMKLVFQEVCRWRSYWPVQETQLEHTVHGIINMLLERLEVQHGKFLLSHALAYLTAARSGLSEGELEDVLSLDDTILDEVFTFWVPPIRRIPPLLWTRIHEDLCHYLVEREADGITVLAWYHRQFREVVQTRYLSDKGVKKYIHYMLAEYFLGTWGEGREKPFQYSDVLVKRTSVQCRDSQADRKVPAQPLKWKFRVGKKVTEVYNLRKLNELPYHLFHADRCHELWKEVFYSYKWLHTKLKATTVMDLLSDLALGDKIDKQRGHGHKILMISSAIRVAGSALKRLPNTLAVELLGRLKPYVQPGEYLEQLAEQCESEGLNHCVLLPAFPCFEAPREALLHSLEGHRQAITDIIFSNDAENLFSISVDGRLNAWDVKTGDLLYSLDIKHTNTGRHSKLLWSAKGYVVVENYTQDSPLVIVDAVTGNVCQQIGSRHAGFIHNTQVTPNSVLREGHLYEVESGRLMHSINYLTEQKSFLTVAVTNNDQHILVGEHSQTVMLSISEESKVCSVPGKYMPSSIEISRQDDKAVIGYSIDCVVKVVNIDVQANNCGQVLFEFDFQKTFPNESFPGGEPYCQEVSELSLSPNQKLALVNVKRVNLFVMPLNGNRVVMLDMESVSVSRPWIHMSYFTYDSNSVVAVVGSKLCLWNAQNGQLVARMSLVGRQEDKFQLVVNPCHDIVATVGKQENAVKLWKLKKLRDSEGPSVHVYSNPVDVVAMDSRRKLAFVKTYRPLSSYKGYHFVDYFGIDVWDIATNTHQAFLQYGRYGSLKQMKMSHDGEFMVLLTSSQIASHVFVINVLDAKVTAHFIDRDIINVELSPINDHLTTESNNKYQDSVLKIWSVKSGKLLKALHDSHHGTFTTCGQALLCISAKKSITACTFEQDNVDTEIIKTRSHGLADVATVPNKPGVVMVSSSVRGYLASKFKLIVLIDASTRAIISVIEKAAPGGFLDVSKDGLLAVDGYLAVHDLDSGKTVLECGTRFLEKEKKLVCITYDGEYVVWADTSPTDCIKVRRVEDGCIVAEAGTHSPVVSLNVVDFGYTVVVGCADGHLLVFKLHHTPKPTDSLASLDKIDVFWPPLSADDISNLDPLYQVKASELRGSKLPETGPEVRQVLEESAKVSLSVQLSRKGDDFLGEGVCSRLCTII